MKIFGKKTEFAIEYNPYLEQYANDPDVIEDPDDYVLGGNIYFWVKNKNLFAFKDWGPTATYGYWNLFALLDFLTNYLVSQLTEEPFPIKTEADNAVDMIEETLLVKNEYGVQRKLQAYMDLDWDNVDMDLMNKRDNWITPRSFLKNNGSTFLPNIIVRRVSDKVEISWYNDTPFSNGKNKFYMQHTTGVEYIDANLYREVITQFCLAYIETIKEKEPELAETYRTNLRKAMRAPI